MLIKLRGGNKTTIEASILLQVKGHQIRPKTSLFERSRSRRQATALPQFYESIRTGF